MIMGNGNGYNDLNMEKRWRNIQITTCSPESTQGADAEKTEEAPNTFLNIYSIILCDFLLLIIFIFLFLF